MEAALLISKALIVGDFWDSQMESGPSPGPFSEPLKTEEGAKCPFYGCCENNRALNTQYVGYVWKA